MKKHTFVLPLLLSTLLVSCGSELPTNWTNKEILVMKDLLGDRVIPFYYIGDGYKFDSPEVEIMQVKQKVITITNQQYPEDLFVRGYIRTCERGGFEGVKSFDNLLIFTSGLSTITTDEVFVLLLFGCLVEGVKEDLKTGLDSLFTSMGISDIDLEIPFDNIPDQSAFFYAIPISFDFDLPEII